MNDIWNTMLNNALPPAQLRPGQPFPGRAHVRPELAMLGRIGPVAYPGPEFMQMANAPVGPFKEFQGPQGPVLNPDPSLMLAKAAPPPQDAVTQPDLNAAAMGGGLSGPAAMGFSGVDKSRVRAHYNDPEYQRLARQLGDSLFAQGEQARDGVALAKEQEQMFNAIPQQLDLSSMAALVDQWSGSNLAKAYDRPISPMERMQAAWELQNAIQKAETGVTDTEMKAFERQLQEADRNRRLGIDMEQALLDREMRGKETSAAEARDSSMTLQARKDFDTRYGKPIVNMGELVAKTKEMADIIDRNGGKPPLTGSDYNRFKSLTSQSIGIFNREVMELGALAGADLSLLEKAISAAQGDAEQFIKNLRSNPGDSSRILRQTSQDIETKISNLQPYIGSVFMGRADEPYQKAMETFYKNAKGMGAKQPTVEDPRIAQFMKDNGIADKEQAIGILKKEGIIR